MLMACVDRYNNEYVYIICDRWKAVSYKVVSLVQIRRAVVLGVILFPEKIKVF